MKTLTCLVYELSITPNDRTLNPCFTVCSSDRFRRYACSPEVHTSYRKRCRNACDQVLEEVALRAAVGFKVLACRHDTRAPVAHEVTDHAVRGYCR
jgi:hypothetical protein